MKYRAEQYSIATNALEVQSKQKYLEQRKTCKSFSGEEECQCIVDSWRGVGRGWERGASFDVIESFVTLELECILKGRRGTGQLQGREGGWVARVSSIYQGMLILSLHCTTTMYLIKRIRHDFLSIVFQNPGRAFSLYVSTTIIRQHAQSSASRLLSPTIVCLKHTITLH